MTEYSVILHYQVQKPLLAQLETLVPLVDLQGGHVAHPRALIADNGPKWRARGPLWPGRWSFPCEPMEGSCCPTGGPLWFDSSKVLVAHQRELVTNSEAFVA